MKTYSLPQAEIIELSRADVLTGSGGDVSPQFYNVVGDIQEADHGAWGSGVVRPSN